MDNVFPVRLISQLRPLLIGFRKSKGLTQRELSARLGVTQQTYAGVSLDIENYCTLRLKINLKTLD